MGACFGDLSADCPHGSTYHVWGAFFCIPLSGFEQSYRLEVEKKCTEFAIQLEKAREEGDKKILEREVEILLLRRERRGCNAQTASSA